MAEETAHARLWVETAEANAEENLVAPIRDNFQSMSVVDSMAGCALGLPAVWHRIARDAFGKRLSPKTRLCFQSQATREK